MPQCSNCGFDNPGEARFCNQCGSTIDGSASRRGERRQITVVFSLSVAILSMGLALLFAVMLADSVYRF